MNILQRERAKAAVQQAAIEKLRNILNQAFEEDRNLTVQEQAMFESLWNTTQPPPSASLNSVAAARRIGVKPETLCRWRLEGRGPRYAKTGKCIRYAAETLDEWLKGNPDAALP